MSKSAAYEQHQTRISTCHSKETQEYDAANPATFVAERDCNTCKTQSLAKQIPGYAVSKKAHHVNCAKSTRTFGKGEIRQQNLETAKESKQLKTLFSAPLKAHEKGSCKNFTKEAGDAFFAMRPTATTTTKSNVQDQQSFVVNPAIAAVTFCKDVSKMTGCYFF